MARARRLSPKIGADDAEKERKIAAAEAAAKEITIAWQEQGTPNGFAVVAARPEYLFTVELEDGSYRKITLHQNHKFLWQGRTRASKKGDVIFILDPVMDAQLTARKAKAIEIAHTELNVAFDSSPKLSEWVTNALGCTIDELIRDGKSAMTDEDIMKAKAMPEEQEAPLDEAHEMPQWGAWS